MGGGFAFVYEIFLALKAELIRFRIAVAILCAVILLAVLFVGLNWTVQYTTSIQLVGNDSNIIQPLLRGRAEIAQTDQSEEAQQRIYSRGLLERVLLRTGYVGDTTDAAQMSDAIRGLRAGIALQPAGFGSPYFSIAYSHPNPDISFETVKVLAEEFIDLHESSKREEGEYAFNFINTQVELYRNRLGEAEAALKVFKTNSPDVTESSVQGRIDELNAQIQDLKLNIQDSETKIYSTKDQLDVESEILSRHTEVVSLRQQQNAMQKELSRLSRQYQDSYPDIVSLKQQIQDIEEQIASIPGDYNLTIPAFANNGGADGNPELLFDALRRQLSAADVELTAQKRRLSSLLELLEEEHKKSDLVTSNQAKLADLTRDYQVTKEVFEELLSRKGNAELSMAITKDGQGLTYKVVDPPVFPLRPSGLTFLEFLLAAPVLAIGIPIGLLLMRILLDPRIRLVSALKNTLDESAIEIIGVSRHFDTNLYARIIRKDMLVVSVMMVSLIIIYFYFAYVGLSRL